MADNENIIEDAGLQPFIEVIQSVMEIPEENLSPIMIDSFAGMITGALTPALREQTINQIITNYRNENLNRGEIKKELASLRDAIENIINGFNPSENRSILLHKIFDNFYTIFDEVENRYHNYDIKLPMTLEEGAQVPTYAHDTDAAADLYAADTVIVPAHSIGNMIRTGVHIGLPEGWVAYIVPRSSIGAKTPLRLSNSVGVIDAGYRGPLGVLYDNISDSDYTINAGDRIAQLIVMPCYHFQATVVESLDETERGEGGFGASGT